MIRPLPVPEDPKGFAQFCMMRGLDLVSTDEAWCALISQAVAPGDILLTQDGEIVGKTG